MNVFENIKKELYDVSKYMELSNKEKDYLLKHKSIQKSELKVNDNKYLAYRIIHNDSLGPGKGGIRFHPNVSEDEVMSLSFWMSIKNSLAGLPYGGAKGGIQVNPKELNEYDLEKLSREYIKHFHKFLGQDKDIPAPDVYTNPKIMGWMLDEFEKIKDRHEPGMITGKPIELGGCAIRGDATSKGGLIVLNEFIQKVNKKPNDLNVVIQGFGNAGMNIAKMLYIKGYNIISVSDSKGGILSNEAIDIEALIKHKNNSGSVLDFKNSKNISNKELLELKTDVLILAALENQITTDNAKDIKAKYIIELANGPITYDANEILTKNKIIVIPDILANSGGVVASYLEWSQNKIGQIHSKEKMLEILENKMKNSFQKVYELYQEKKHEYPMFNMKTAAYIIAIKRLLNAAKARGEIPV